MATIQTMYNWLSINPNQMDGFLNVGKLYVLAGSSIRQFTVTIDFLWKCEKRPSSIASYGVNYLNFADPNQGGARAHQQWKEKHALPFTSKWRAYESSVVMSIIAECASDKIFHDVCYRRKTAELMIPKPLIIKMASLVITIEEA